MSPRQSLPLDFDLKPLGAYFYSYTCKQEAPADAAFTTVLLRTAGQADIRHPDTGWKGEPVLPSSLELVA